MTDSEKIFLNTFYDLQQRLDNCTKYDVIRCSGLIRQLLVDSNSIVNQVNKNYRLKIKYRVQQRFEFPEPEPLENGVIPKVLYGMTFILPDDKSTSIEMLSKDDFFKYVVLNNGDENFSVLDVIKICANKYGGIHLDDLKKPEEKSLDNLHKHFTFNDSSSILQAMHSISKICIIALEPLKNKIENKIK